MAQTATRRQLPAILQGGTGRQRPARVAAHALLAASQRIKDCWNRHVGGLPGASKVTKINDDRARSLCKLLETFTIDQICRAIEYYATSPWNRENRAWRKFDNVLNKAFIGTWWEKYTTHRDSGAHRAANARTERDQDRRDRTDAVHTGGASPVWRRDGARRDKR